MPVEDKNKLNLLIVDDERRVREGIKLSLSGENFNIIESEHPDQAYQIISDGSVDVVLLDIHFQGNLTSLPILDRLQREGNQIPIIVLSGAASAEEASDAIKFGAYDYLEKPITSERLRVTIQNTLQSASLKAKAFVATVIRNARTDIIGESSKIQEVRKLIGQFGCKDVKVLITGETGTGKELVAHGLWRDSGRSDRPYVVVNSAAIPDSLIESELFGHRKGAFTGAVANQIGKIEMADGGTLFLDEIGELSPMAQSKLLRFLETGEIQVVGSNKVKRCDVRIIAATSRNLAAEIKAGRFREDLYFRLNVGHISVPSLRERREDILLLFSHFMSTICQRYGEISRILDEGAKKLLIQHSWPGNVRELRNIAERAVLLSTHEISKELIQNILGVDIVKSQNGELPSTLEGVLPLKEYRHQIEALYIAHVLQLAGGSITKAAKALEIDRSHLHQRIKDLLN